MKSSILSSTSLVVRHTIHLQDGKTCKAAFSKATREYRIYVAGKMLFYTDHNRKVYESHPILDMAQRLHDAIKLIDQVREREIKQFEFEYVGSVKEMREKTLKIPATSHEEAWKNLTDTYFWLTGERKYYKMLTAAVPTATV